MTKRTSTARKTDHAVRTKGFDSIAYQTDAKEEYRRRIWDQDLFAQAKDRLVNPNDRILIMPSANRFELDHAIASGIRPDQIIVVDHKKDILKAAWRRDFKGVKIFVADIGDLPELLAKKKLNLVAANLDLCAAIGDGVKQSLRRFWEGVRGDQFLLGLSLVKGRGSAAANQELDRYFDDGRVDCRLRWALSEAGIVDPREAMPTVDAGWYFSGLLPMVWGVFTPKPLACTV